MPWFFLQTKYASQSFDAMIKKPQNRFNIMREVVKNAGGTLHAFFYTLGSESDVMAIVEAPSYERLSAFLMVYAASPDYRGFSKITPLLSPEEGLEAMKLAGELRQYYKSPTD